MKEQRSAASVALATLAWPASQVGEALICLARQSGLLVTFVDVPAPPQSSGVPTNAFSLWFEASAQQLGLEVEPIQTTFGEATDFVQGVGPALLRLPLQAPESEGCFLALLRSRGRWTYLIAPDHSVQRVQNRVVQDALWAELLKPQRALLEPMLAQTGVPAHRLVQTQNAMLADLLGATELDAGWLLRLAPGAPLQRQAQQARLLRTLGMLLGSYSSQLLLTVLAWWLIGRGALTGEFAWSWMLAWALVLLTTIPFQLLTSLTQRQLVMRVGELFKVRLLYGVLQLQPEEIRHQGAGHFLGRVLAADLVEQLALAGGFVSLLAVFQLGVACVILATGIGGWLSALFLCGWLLAAIALGWRYSQVNAAWTLVHRTMTNDLVERMVGHRTRLAQEDHFHWHTEEDLALERYIELQVQADQTANWLAYVPRSWMVCGLAGFVYILLTAQPTATQLAISLGGILLAYQALASMIGGTQSLANVRSAWREVGVLFHAATREQAAGHGLAVTLNPRPSPCATALNRSSRGVPLSRPGAADFGAL